MTTPLSFTSSRYTGAEARRSLERTSVVSIITSWPIQASGIFPSEPKALGLSLSIMASSSDRCPPASVEDTFSESPSPFGALFGGARPRAKRQERNEGPKKEPFGGSVDRRRR